MWRRRRAATAPWPITLSNATDRDMWLDPFFQNKVAQDVVATLITFALALGWLRLIDALAVRGFIEQRLSRKVIHIGTGPVFVLCWLLYADRPEARWLAALVPLMIVAQFALVGMGILKDEAAVQAMSRTGNPREILRGPLYYGIVFVADLSRNEALRFAGAAADWIS